MSEPLKRVSAKGYERAAKVKMRIKGNDDGHVYQGQEIHTQCKTCPNQSPVKKPLQIPNL